jgi:DNA-directed RNA polymerase subunit E"
MKFACKKCKTILTQGGSECPVCHSKELTSKWKGKLIVLNPEKSQVAQKLSIKTKGEYAIKV